MTAPMEWRIATDALSAILPTLARGQGSLHLAYDLTRDQWTVANDAAYDLRREEAVMAIRAALAPYGDEESTP